jgi:cytosine/adenosine deaminase-related metal-dependent hydrolase
VTIHWAETEAEGRWLRDGSGPLAALLGPSPRARGLTLLERAGLLGPRLALVHGNHPAAGELARIARARATLVHCPGSHAFFARPRAPIAAWLRAGVEVALGTDSLASNDDLDMYREMALLRASHPGLAPRIVWRMATLGGARALGWAGRVGELRPGAWADCVLLDTTARDDDALLDALTAGERQVQGVFVAARRARIAPGSASSQAFVRPARAARARPRYGLRPRR